MLSLTSRKTRSYRVLALALAAYSLLASARELVPGLCATLAAVQDADAACRFVSHACCAETQSPSRPGDVTSIHAKGAAHPKCAFCALAKGLLKTETAVDAPANPLSFVASSPRAATDPSLDRVCAESRPRDPPSLTFAT
ncbi:MAG: hypothetical protein HUU46_18330 [Candidatus Hydrogenedentes bacterium]|nr:hypothetical protein [Candidatus Hydrogenedentota bacterium]